jgi:hypothetical protein
MAAAAAAAAAALVVVIRQYTWWLMGKYPKDRIPPALTAGPKGNRIHADHCIESLRLSLMCQADVTPVLALKVPTAALGRKGEFSSHHRCRNFYQDQGMGGTKHGCWRGNATSFDPSALGPSRWVIVLIGSGIYPSLQEIIVVLVTHPAQASQAASPARRADGFAV